MPVSGRFLSSTCVAVLMAATSSQVAFAQACLGGPEGSSIAFEHTTYSLGSGFGVLGALSGKRTAFDLALRSRSVADDYSGFGGGLRFSFLLPISKLLVCPGLGIDATRDEIDINPSVSVTTTAVAARAGAGFGFEQKVSDDVSVIPFAGLYYRFRAIMFETDAPGETFTTADSSSHLQIEYGITARYRFLFLGVAAERTSDTEGSRADFARLFIGFTSSRKRD